MKYSFYYVTKARRADSKKPLECYGSHATLEGAITDSVNRAKEYQQSTSIYGVLGDNSITLIQTVKV